jgi:uncharacterized membrane protein
MSLFCVFHFLAFFQNILFSLKFPENKNFFKLVLQTLLFALIQDEWIASCKVENKSSLTLSLLMSRICGVSKMFGEWYQKTNKTEDTNKLHLLAFKIIALLHNTRLATFIKLLETVSKSLFRNRSQNSCHTFLDCRRTAAIQ